MSEADLSILAHFRCIPDPRREQGRLHLIGDILVISLCAVITGSNSFRQIETFAQEKEAWLRGFLTLPHGIPSHDTFARVFALIKPSAFENCFVDWMNSACQATDLTPIQIDGKTLRGSRRRGADGQLSPALHLVSAWAGQNRITLGQVAVEGKSNEIVAIPELLRTLDLKGCIVSIDAIGCQKAIASQIRTQKGDYVLAVKENQPTLHDDIEALFEKALDTEFAGLRHSEFRSEEKGHGRQEKRTYWSIIDPPGLSTKSEWEGLRSVVLVTRERTVRDKSSVEVAYFISSAALEGSKLEEVIRGHWEIENGLHWSLDVIFGEDGNRTVARNAAANLSLVRKVALSLLRGTGGKQSVPQKRVKAAHNEEYLKQVLGGLNAKPKPQTESDATTAPNPQTC